MATKCTCPDSHARLYEMCPMHKSAPKLFKALKAAEPLWAMLPFDSGDDIYQLAKQVAAKQCAAVDEAAS